MTTLSGEEAVPRVQAGGLTAQDFFPFLAVPPQVCFVAAVLSLIYAISVPVLSYVRSAEILLSDLSIYFLLGAWVFYLAGMAVRKWEQESRS